MDAARPARAADRERIDELRVEFFAELRDHDSRPPGARSTYGAAANRSEPYPAGDGG